MRQKWLKLKRINGGLQRYWKLSVVSFLVLGEAIASSGNYAWGQIASDNTLGSESSLVTSPIPGAFLIKGGATRGTNLFHSFSEFSVPTLGIAYFNNVGEIQNIVSHVTGGSISNIDGLIAANGTANLFLLNPVEAQEWVINDKGQVVLTSSTPTAPLWFMAFATCLSSFLVQICISSLSS